MILVNTKSALETCHSQLKLFLWHCFWLIILGKQTTDPELSLFLVKKSSTKCILCCYSSWHSSNKGHWGAFCSPARLFIWIFDYYRSPNHRYRLDTNFGHKNQTFYFVCGWIIGSKSDFKWNLTKGQWRINAAHTNKFPPLISLCPKLIYFWHKSLILTEIKFTGYNENYNFPVVLCKFNQSNAGEWQSTRSISNIIGKLNLIVNNFNTT